MCEREKDTKRSMREEKKLFDEYEFLIWNDEHLEQKTFFTFYAYALKIDWIGGIVINRKQLVDWHITMKNRAECFNFVQLINACRLSFYIMKDYSKIISSS